MGSCPWQGQPRGRKIKLISTAADVPLVLALEMTTSYTADIGSELIRRIEELMKVATTSSNYLSHVVIVSFHFDLPKVLTQVVVDIQSLYVLLFRYDFKSPLLHEVN